MTERDTNQVREEAYRAAAAAVDRVLGRIGDPVADHLDEVGNPAWDRFRAELGRVVDLNLDVVRSAFGMYSTLLRPEMFRREGRSDLLALGPVVPGSEAGAVLWLHNFDDDPMPDLGFVGSALTLAGNNVIRHPRWSFSPRWVTVPPRSAIPVAVRVEVHDRTPAGSYVGTVSVTGGEGQTIEVHLEVVATEPIPHDSW
jgi:hypothetical protein